MTPFVPHVVEFDCPEAGLTFNSLIASEQLSALFKYEFFLKSDRRDLALADFLGKTMMVGIEAMKGTRYFHGYISRFSAVRSEERYDVYQATVVPWLWFLNRYRDSRIFQNQSVPDIVVALCKQRGFTDIRTKLSRTYRTWEYCVQYRESDLDFVSRLMEQEGIYYFFEHEAGKHTLVLTDATAMLNTVSGYETVPFFPPANAGQRERDHFSSWSCSKQIVSGAYVVDDYNFETPSADIKSRLTSPDVSSQSRSFEVYDYPAEYTNRAEGDAYVRARIEELVLEHEQFEGSGNVVGLSAGVLFDLADYPRADLNRKYLVVATQYHVEGGTHWSGSSTSHEATVQCSVQAIDGTRSYRAPRVTPKPVVPGPQTAVVVGPDGEEIYTDKYGRIKVQFFWDRLGKRNEQSSCWIRVANVWAGKKWGAIHIPRIKQEVIVEFIEGDPDRPIVIGTVYNAENMPPYDLPANMTQSGIKSRSSKGGTDENFNEIRFEDKKGQEQIYIHAERNQDIVVEKDETVSIGENRTENVGNNEFISIGNDRTEEVAKNESITIGENRTESVGKNESVTIGENRTEDVGKDERVTIGGAREHNIGKNAVLSVGQDSIIDIGKNYSLTAGDQITLTTGSASITMKKNGDIIIKGNNITIDGSGKINAKAGGDVILKGSSIKQN